MGNHQTGTLPGNNQIKIEKGFWGTYRRLVRDKVIPYQWHALNDTVEDADPSYCVANMNLAAEKNQTGTASASFRGMVFQDSDLYKWLEAVAYQLASEPDQELEKTANDLITVIGQAQEPDGYLNTYYTLADPENKWTNLRDNHELYCSGHMIEAAVAWYEGTGRRNFLNIAVKNADLIRKLFGGGPAQIKGYPGHPELELALMRLYTVTDNQDYLDLAEFFIRERGQRPLYFEDEAARRDHDHYWASEVMRIPLRYCLADQPLTDQETLDGHSVRALYLLAGLIDVACAKNDSLLISTAHRLWDNCVSRRMYVTGGVGSTHHGEAFTFDYHLPNDTVYAETCASIALIFAARRLLSHELDSHYADVMERALYNTCLAGMQLDGTRFFYVNPLMVSPDASAGDIDHWHVKPQRQKWFACACCPPNLARLLASLGQYAYGQQDDNIQLHLYVESKVQFGLSSGIAELDCQTNYPADGQIILNKTGSACGLDLRIPDWCSQYKLIIQGEDVKPVLNKGYAHIECAAGDVQIELLLQMPVLRVYANAAVPENAGKVCLQRGPLVYCLEEADMGKSLWNCQLPRDAMISEESKPDLLGGVVVLTARGRMASTQSDRLYCYDQPPAGRETLLTFIPYYTWANRQAGEMTVWLQEI